MEKIIMLGVGSGGTFDLYNTCFLIQNENGNFLVDTGGSIEIIRRLKRVDIDFKQLQHIFISHSHTDHILGLIWMFKKLGVAAMHGEIKTKLNIYCNDVVYDSIIEVSKQILPEKLVKEILNIVDFHILDNEEKKDINGVEYTFFDINARDKKQFGFECIINKKRLIFLGDETIKPSLYEKVRGADYVMHEAFCLDSEEKIFKPYERNHSTVKSASLIMNNLEVKNLILYHTEEKHGDERKALYTKEGIENFKGNIYVPNELEVIKI